MGLVLNRWEESDLRGNLGLKSIGGTNPPMCALLIVIVILKLELFMKVLRLRERD